MPHSPGDSQGIPVSLWLCERMKQVTLSQLRSLSAEWRALALCTLTSPQPLGTPCISPESEPLGQPYPLQWDASSALLLHNPLTATFIHSEYTQPRVPCVLLISHHGPIYPLWLTEAHTDTWMDGCTHTCMDGSLASQILHFSGWFQRFLS